MHRILALALAQAPMLATLLIAPATAAGYSTSHSNGIGWVSTPVIAITLNKRSADTWWEPLRLVLARSPIPVCIPAWTALGLPLSRSFYAAAYTDSVTGNISFPVPGNGSRWAHKWGSVADYHVDLAFDPQFSGAALLAAFGGCSPKADPNCDYSPSKLGTSGMRHGTLQRADGATVYFAAPTPNSPANWRPEASWRYKHFWYYANNLDVAKTCRYQRL